MPKNLHVIIEIIEDLLDRKIDMNENTKFTDLPEWDSLTQTVFLVTVENELKVEIDIKKAVEIQEVFEFCRWLDQI